MSNYNLFPRISMDKRSFEIYIDWLEKNRILNMIKGLKNDAVRLAKCLDDIEAFHRDMFVLLRKKDKPADIKNGPSVQDSKCLISEPNRSVSEPEGSMTEPNCTVKGPHSLTDEQNSSKNDQESKRKKERLILKIKKSVLRNIYSDEDEPNYSCGPSVCKNQSGDSTEESGEGMMESAENVVESDDNMIVELVDNIMMESVDNIIGESGDYIIVESGENMIVESGDTIIVESGDNMIVESGDNMVEENDGNKDTSLSTEESFDTTEEWDDGTKGYVDGLDETGVGLDESGYGKNKIDLRKEFAKEALLELLADREKEITKKVLHLISKFSCFQNRLKTFESHASQIGKPISGGINVDVMKKMRSLYESVLYLDKTISDIYAKYSDMLVKVRNAV